MAGSTPRQHNPSASSLFARRLHPPPALRARDSQDGPEPHPKGQRSDTAREPPKILVRNNAPDWVNTVTRLNYFRFPPPCSSRPPPFSSPAFWPLPRPGWPRCPISGATSSRSSRPTACAATTPRRPRADCGWTPTRKSWKAASEGEAMVPGKPEESELIVRIHLRPIDEGFMPDEGQALKAGELELLTDWVKAGAAVAGGGHPHERKPAPIKRVALPKAPRAISARRPPHARRHPQARECRRGVSSPPRIDDAAFLRRATIDLIGRIPTMKEVARLRGLGRRPPRAARSSAPRRSRASRTAGRSSWRTCCASARTSPAATNSSPTSTARSRTTNPTTCWCAS